MNIRRTSHECLLPENVREIWVFPSGLLAQDFGLPTRPDHRERPPLDLYTVKGGVEELLRPAADRLVVHTIRNQLQFTAIRHIDFVGEFRISGDSNSYKEKPRHHVLLAGFLL